MNRSELQRVWAEDTAAVISRDLPWQKFSGLTFAVTGAGGFLGGYLVRILLGLYTVGRIERPIRVLALVRDVDRVRERLGPLTDNPDLELRTWDLNDISVPDLGDCQYVLHAASQASPRFYGSDPVGTLMPNAVGTASLLTALKSCPDPRGLLFVSSSEVYGQVGGDSVLVETVYGQLDPATVRACYAESKRMGETLCVAWHQQFGLPTYIVRPFHTYGPGLLANDGRVFSDFAYNVARGEDIVMMSDGSARRAFCYASDAIAGFFTVLLNGQPATPYNVANPEGELSVMELAELLAGLYPDRGLKVDRRMPSADRDYLTSTFSRLIPDVRRLSSLGWSAQVTPQQGFRRMIETLTA
jgi:UDP-glucuronate decarboxylase